MKISDLSDLIRWHLMTTPGAGVDPRDVIRPGKRLRNWHRQHGAGVSLRAFVRTIAAAPENTANRIIAGKWLASKGARP